MTEDDTDDFSGTDPSPLPAVKEPKDPKGSARRSYNNRVKHAKAALISLKVAAQRLLDQPGATYGKESIEKVLKAVDDFEKNSGLELRHPDISKETWERLEAALGLPPAPYPYGDDGGGASSN